MRLISTWVLAFAAVGFFGCGDDGGSGGSGGSGGTGEPSAMVHFDEFGILNADCQTDEACAEVLGYYHARDRFIQMDFRRRFTTGRLTDILAPALLSVSKGIALPVAIENRGLFMARDGTPAEESLLSNASPKTMTLLEAYAEGVNAWLKDLRNGENGAQFPREFGTASLQVIEYNIEDIPDWTPADSIATVLALIEALTNDEGSHTSRANARAALMNDDKFADLYSSRPIKESSVLPAGTYSPSMPSGTLASLMSIPNQDNSPSPLMSYPPAGGVEAFAMMERVAELQRKAAQVKGWLGLPDRGNDTGSNNWVVTPSAATGDNALLSNDPHLSMTQPATWYLAHLDAKTNGTGEFHTAGVTFAGLPWVILGQNEDIAWGATTTTFDMSDVYVEELVRDMDGEPLGVMFNGNIVAFTRVSVDFPFRDGTTETTEILIVPHHGPVRGEIAADDTTCLTLRWTGHDADSDINALTELSVATNLAEARIALENVTTIGQNWAIIDSDGNAGWYPYNRLPTRPWATGIDGAASPLLPIDGTGAFEWGPYIPYAELPQVTNPSTGYIATANNDMTGALFDGDASDDGHTVLQSDAAAGYRHARIAELLEELAPNHTTATMDAIVSDVHSLIGEEMTPNILTIANDAMTTLSANGQKVVGALTAWDFSCPTGLTGPDAAMAPLVFDAGVLLSSAGCAAFHVALEQLREAVLADDNAPGGRGPNYALFYSIMDPTQLVAGDVYWDNISTVGTTETKFDTMAVALDAAGDFLVAKLGADESQWAWGRIHQLKLSADLSAFFINDFNNPPNDEAGFANNGGLFTVDVANPNAEYVQNAGPSMRFVCEGFPTGPTCTIQLPGGQSAHIDSANYESLLEDYIANVPMPLQMDIADAAANATTSVAYP